MSKPTQEEIQKAITSCKWRKELYDVPVCRLGCSPCVHIIESGDCDALKDLFSKKTEVIDNE